MEEARADLTEAAKRAVENLASAKVMRVNQPIFASLRAVPPANLRFLDGVPGIDYEDDTVTFVTDDLRAAYDGLVKIVGVAGMGYLSLLQEVVGGREDSAEIWSDFTEALLQRWYDQESGRYERPSPPEPKEESGRQYHGYE